jgi:hypothetical protein
MLLAVRQACVLLSAVASLHFDETLRFGVRLQQYVWRQVNLAGGTNPQQLTSSASCGTAAAKACLLWRDDAQHIRMHGEPLWQTAKCAMMLGFPVFLPCCLQVYYTT